MFYVVNDQGPTIQTILLDISYGHFQYTYKIIPSQQEGRKVYSSQII